MNAIKQPSIVNDLPADPDQLLEAWDNGTMLKSDYLKLFRAARVEMKRRGKLQDWIPLSKVEHNAASHYSNGWTERGKLRWLRRHVDAPVCIGYIHQQSPGHWCVQYLLSHGQAWEHHLSQSTREGFRSRLDITRDYLAMLGLENYRTAVFIDKQLPAACWVSGLYVRETLDHDGGKLLDVNDHATGVALMNWLYQLTPHRSFYIQTVRRETDGFYA
jgi:hypothetical protein